MNDVPPGEQQEARNDLVLSFLSVRRALGVLGFALPLTLAAIGWITGDGLAPSISEFYFTSAGDVLVGTMCAIGVFLWAYRGFEKRPGEFLTDYWVSRLAALGAFGVALIPTAGPATNPLPLMHRLFGVPASHLLHYLAASTFFVCLALFCLVLFRRHDPAKPMDARKIAQNRIYFVCGLILSACILAITAVLVVYRTLDAAGRAAIDDAHIIYYLESIGVFAFATSWLTKGKSMARLERLFRSPE